MKSFSFLLLFKVLPFTLAAQAAPEYTGGPEQVQVVTVDIDRFWIAYDLAYPWFDSRLFDSLYLRPGTEALRATAALWLGDAAALSDLLRDQWDYYESVRAATLSVHGQEAAVRAALFAWKYLYPEAQFVDLYFLIGGREGVALALNDCLIINAGAFGIVPAPPTRLRRLTAPRYPAEALPSVVIRELVRRQLPAEGPLPLLAQAIREGIADLISELTTGRLFRPEAAAYARPREWELWQEFRRQMHDWPTAGWLYRGARDRPDNVGAWIGYRIARAFYDRAADKRQAIRELMTVHDYEGLLEKSGYEAAVRAGLSLAGSQP